jgi:hypothetical protein
MNIIGRWQFYAKGSPKDLAHALIHVIYVLQLQEKCPTFTDAFWDKMKTYGLEGEILRDALRSIPKP